MRISKGNGIGGACAVGMTEPNRSIAIGIIAKAPRIPIAKSSQNNRQVKRRGSENCSLVNRRATRLKTGSGGRPAGVLDYE
ncbi:MAG: hypothetical protein H0U18_15470 [Pyrinomonadaceae bacterium]|nr:hypothetical protein [Pyrinomonadaceae bacterium]